MTSSQSRIMRQRWGGTHRMRYSKLTQRIAKAHWVCCVWGGGGGWDQQEWRRRHVHSGAADDAGHARDAAHVRRPTRRPIETQTSARLSTPEGVFTLVTASAFSAVDVKGWSGSFFGTHQSGIRLNFDIDVKILLSTSKF